MRKSLISMLVGLMFTQHYVVEPGTGGGDDDTTSLAGISELLQKQAKAFTEFKAANDKKIAEIEAAGVASKSTLAEVEKLSAALTKLTDEIKTAGERMNEIEKKANRPGAAEGDSPEVAEHKDAFGKFLRKGDDSGLRDLEVKALQTGSDPDGGYLVPVELDRNIDRVASSVSAMAGLADVRTIGSESIKMRVKTSGVSARWVGEGETGGESATPQYAVIEIKAEELEAEPWIFNSTLDDADVDLENEVTDEAGIGFGEAVGYALVGGNGKEKPRGILAYDTVVNSAYAWGKVGYIFSGHASSFASTNPADALITLIHSLKSVYRQGAVLLMNDATLGLIRQFKDGSGNYYLFNPDATGKFGGFILGVPVVIDDNMPDVAANSFPIAYANFKRAYRFVNRKGTSLIRDNITVKGTTKFNFRKRVGGGIRNFEAIKLFKIATS